MLFVCVEEDDDGRDRTGGREGREERKGGKDGREGRTGGKDGREGWEGGKDGIGDKATRTN